MGKRADLYVALGRLEDAVREEMGYLAVVVARGSAEVEFHMDRGCVVDERVGADVSARSAAVVGTAIAVAVGSYYTAHRQKKQQDYGRRP